MTQRKIDRVIFIFFALAVAASLGYLAIRRYSKAPVTQTNASEPAATDVTSSESEAQNEQAVESEASPSEQASITKSEQSPPATLGLSVLSEDEQAALSEGKTVIEHPAKLWDILRFNGNPIPFDEKTNTAYITQSLESADFEGVFQTVHSDTDAYWLDVPGTATGKNDAVQAGTPHRLWISAPDTCTTIQVVFTSLPVVELFTQNRLSSEYSYSEIFVWDAKEDEIKASFSYATAKESASGESITAKLYQADYARRNRLSFLDMGGYDAWKLYPVNEGQPFHMMLAFELWNLCGSDDRLSVPCRYAELVVNGRYQGLCILRPRTDDDCFTKLQSPTVVIDTDDLEPEEVPHDLYQSYPPENLSDLGLYLEATYAYANLYDDVAILKDREDAFYAVPGKAEYSFGNFPRRYNYLSYQFDQRVITSADFGLDGEGAQTFDKALEQRWAEARGGFLKDESIAARLAQYSGELRASGYAARKGYTTAYENAATLWGGTAPEHGDLLEAYAQLLKNAISGRFSVVDGKLG